MGRDRTGLIWDEIRRALGHFVGRAAIHTLPDDRFGIAPIIRQPSLSACDLARPGEREAEWVPAAQVQSCVMPAAVSGGGGMDLASVPVAVGANQALGAEPPQIADNCCAISPGAIEAWDLERGALEMPEIRDGVVRLEVSDHPLAASKCEAPGVHAVQMLTKLPQDRGRQASWTLPQSRQQSDISSAMRVPLRCEKLPGRSGVAPEQAFALECKQLAAANRTEESDVVLLGVFPHVPLAAVKRLSMAHDGRALEVWLDSERIGRAAKLVTVTIILGRQRTTGQVVQTIRRSVDSAGK